ncbi:serine hydrolase [Streptococcus sciuri]|uniref:Serine hydrolase n=1 Tax=Streptococcus sciuri TaxID=2973939 RepID=A0ABT2F6B1_9STRE|nr:serine hydrolase [Streptococcus sciuri]MCS4487984.1 serine hydrolase [Streptococcus sciuri]
MKKLAIIMLSTFLFLPRTVDSTERDGELTEAQKKTFSDTTTQLLYFTDIPKVPRLSLASMTYNDVDLTNASVILQKETLLKVVAILTNNKGVRVFQLANGTYIEASHNLIFDDRVVSSEGIDEIRWLKNDSSLYNAPYTYGVTKQANSLNAGDRLHLVEKAVTHYGIYYKLENGGWISEEETSTTDTRMLKVQALLNSKYNKSNYSVYVKQLTTQAIAGINMDQTMYSASIAKLATLYITQEKINTGELSYSQKWTYVDAVNHFNGSYNPSGSGQLSKEADNKEYSVEKLLKLTAQHSDNVAANMLGYYATNQFDNSFYQTVRTITSQNLTMTDRQLSAHSAGNLMEAIYHQNGRIIDYLSQTDFDDKRISKDIPVQVAHKVGDAYDYKHDVAIVYTKSPFILSIFTDKASYSDISQIANDIYNILK